MSASSQETSLWFIFQGDEAKRHVESLRRSAARLESIDFHLSSDAGLRSNHAADASRIVPGTIFERVLQDVSVCHGAIAVVARTGRDASEQGNLWLETGMWLARRDVHLLKICHYGEIPAISDINNLPFSVYRTLDELGALVAEHALHVRDFHNTTNAATAAFQKVQSTFCSNPGTSPWLNSQSYSCHRNWLEREECPFRKHSLEFVAELLRMGRANYERYTFEDCLSRIAYACRNLYYAGLAGRAQRHMGEIDTYSRALRTGVASLSRLVRQLLGGPDRDVAYADDPKSPEERFACFIGERLEVAKRLGLDTAELEETLPIESLQVMSRTLLHDLRLLAGHSQEYRFTDPRRDPTFTNELWRLGDACFSLSACLQRIGRVYFDDCSKALKEHLGKSNALHFYQELRAAIDALPHNRRDSGHMPIWRS